MMVICLLDIIVAGLWVTYLHSNFSRCLTSLFVCLVNECVSQSSNDISFNEYVWFCVHVISNMNL